MATIAELAVSIVADTDRYVKGLDKAEGATSAWAKKMGNYAKQLDQVNTQTQSWASNLAGNASRLLGGVMVGAAGAAAGAVAAISGAALNVSKDTEIAAANMAAQLDIPTEKALEFADIARDVYGNNFAGNVIEAGEVVAEAYRRMGNIGDEQLQRITEQAFALADNFDTGPTEAISAAQTLMDNFGVSSDEAFDLIARGFQRGLNRSGDLLDTINEYSIQFGEAGTSAAQFLGLLESGLQGGNLGTDKAADLFKEFFVRIQDGSDTTAAALEDIGLDSQDLLSRLSSGATNGADAFGEVITALYAIDDPLLLSQAGVALLGTQFEDLGQSLGSIDLIADSFEDIAGAADQLNAKYNNFGDMFAGIWRKAVVSVTPATDKLLELANDAMPWVEAAFDKLAEFIPPAIDFAVEAVDKGIAFISGLFQGPLGEGIEAGVGHFQFVRDWIDENMPLIQQTVETVLGAIQRFWDRHGETIMRVVRNFMSIVQTVVDTYLRNVLDLFTVIMQLVNGDFEAAGNTLNQIAERTMQAFFQVIAFWLDSVKTVFENVDWGALGRGIIQAIINGLQSAGGLLVSAVQGAVSGAISGAANLIPGVNIGGTARAGAASQTQNNVTINVNGGDTNQTRNGVVQGLRAVGVTG